MAVFCSHDLLDRIFAFLARFDRRPSPIFEENQFADRDPFFHWVSPLISFIKTCRCVHNSLLESRGRSCIGSFEHRSSCDFGRSTVLFHGSPSHVDVTSYLQHMRRATVVGGGYHIFGEQFVLACSLAMSGQTYVGRWTFPAEAMRWLGQGEHIASRAKTLQGIEVVLDLGPYLTEGPELKLELQDTFELMVDVVDEKTPQADAYIHAVILSPKPRAGGCRYNGAWTTYCVTGSRVDCVYLEPHKVNAAIEREVPLHVDAVITVEVDDYDEVESSEEEENEVDDTTATIDR
eukprot:gnl/TRDRNA2_/TRDRNA2_176906_c0_seq14.p1 gnl/TRDRNA2_/TRDRNA2_176906_c0~~gnl/TRDRNA2_/TRDRNA2_176906_c0_seq14.p1  ORF type:complete len:291 (+),score=23.43 gnl/TRDRNA2_/TRDRNA2_176906_c0_seq14:115-987(+)